MLRQKSINSISFPRHKPANSGILTVDSPGTAQKNAGDFTGITVDYFYWLTGLEISPA
jgi:hypothetical protein